MEYSQLLNFLWRAGEFSGRIFDAVTGEKITINNEGESLDSGSQTIDTEGVWSDVSITVDGERRRGTVVVGTETKVPSNVILRVVETAKTADAGATKNIELVLGSDDGIVPQIEYAIAPETVRIYDELRAGASEKKCAEKIVRMDKLRLTELYTALLVGRLRRKTERVMETFRACGMDWHQTFHTMLLTAMGGDKNREAFAKTAQKATALMISREKSELKKVEALLLGAAGFLHAPTAMEHVPAETGQSADASAKQGGEEEKQRVLYDEFRHLANKYQITPLRPSEWDFSRLFPANHPEERLMAIAALIFKREFMLEAALDCANADDVERLFTDTNGRSIGRTKAHLVGINLVAPLMFAYGKETGAEHLCERALDLLATIPAEKNAKLAGWYDRGVVAENGFDSQALLELTTEFCERRDCARCRVGRGCLTGN